MCRSWKACHYVGTLAFVKENFQENAFFNISVDVVKKILSKFAAKYMFRNVAGQISNHLKTMKN